MHRLSLTHLQDIAANNRIWVIGDPPTATITLERKADVLYLSKLAVAPDMRGKGLARTLVSFAETEARALGLKALELQSRIELTETHAAFHALGFAKAGETSHPGFQRTTSITMRKDV